MKILKAIVKYWILIAMIITGLCGLIYVTVQQDLRLSADDPQIQLAEDAAAKLAAGQQIQNVVPTDQVDIATSLAPYIIIFDANGKPIASSAQLDGQTPTIPAGIFDFVRQKGEDRISWQPRPRVRTAIVVTQFKRPNSGFVLAGRSLREVGIREDSSMHIVLLGWISMLLVTLFATAIIFSFEKPSRESASGSNNTLPKT